MFERSVIQRTCILFLSVASLCAAGPCGAQTARDAKAADAAPPAAGDMAMPDDLGAPLPDSSPASAAGPTTLSVDTPIAVVAANPRGKAVLEHRLPGLCERPEYMMFKGMSLARLATLSHGRISAGKLDQLQADLIRVDVTSQIPRAHNPLTQSSRSIGRLSHSLYRRVVMVIAAL